MALEFGMSFNPAHDGGKQPQQQGGPSQTPIQDAIKTLSLRIPQFRGPGLAPQPLLNAQGGGGVMGQGSMPGGLQQILAQLFGNQGQQGQGQPSPMGQGSMPPPPNIIPGKGPSVPSGGGMAYQPPPQGPSYSNGDPGFDTPPDTGHYFPGNWRG